MSLNETVGHQPIHLSHSFQAMKEVPQLQLFFQSWEANQEPLTCCASELHSQSWGRGVGGWRVGGGSGRGTWEWGRGTFAPSHTPITLCCPQLQSWKPYHLQLRHRLKFPYEPKQPFPLDKLIVSGMCYSAGNRLTLLSVSLSSVPCFQKHELFLKALPLGSWPLGTVSLSFG